MSDFKNLAKKFVDSLNEGSIEQLLSIIHPEYIQHNRYAEPGKRGVEKFFSHFLEALSDIRVEGSNMMADGDLVAGRFSYTGTHSGYFLGAPPTGKTVQMTSIDIWRVQDGLFVEHWDELNMLELLGQLGLVPSTPNPNSDGEGS